MVGGALEMKNMTDEQYFNKYGKLKPKVVPKCKKKKLSFSHDAFNLILAILIVLIWTWIISMMIAL